MQLAPPIALHITRWDHGRAALAGLSALVLGSSCLWAWSAAHEGRFAWPVWLGFITVVGLALAAGWQQAGQWRRPLQLRWDGQDWWLGPGDGDDDHLTQMGTIEPTIDLGSWLLLRWRPVGCRSITWLPLQRSAAPSSWHALRCAVYSPRPIRALSNLQSPHAAMTDLTP